MAARCSAVACGQGLLYLAGTVAVGEDIQLRFAGQFEIGMLADHVGKGPRPLDPHVDEQFVPLAADDRETGMDQHGHPRPRPFQGMAAQILGAVTQDIVGMVFDGRQGGRVLEDDHPRPHRHIELLVRIDGDRVGPLDAGQQVAVAVGEEGRPAPGGIDMEMAAELPGEIGQRLQRVDVAGFGGAGDADQRQRQDVPLLQAPALLPQRLQVDAVAGVGLHLDQVVPADAEQVGGLAEGVVAALGDEDGDAVAAAVLQGRGPALPGQCRGKVPSGAKRRLRATQSAVTLAMVPPEQKAPRACWLLWIQGG